MRNIFDELKVLKDKLGRFEALKPTYDKELERFDLSQQRFVNRQLIPIEFKTVGLAGCDFHLMSELPENPAQYKNSYIFIKTNDTQELYYIKPDGKYEKAKIVDFKLFEEKINAIKNKDETKLHLSQEQIKEIVTLNGVHTRLASDEQANEYSTKVIQAAYVIADYAAAGYASAVWNGSYISNAFRFLDKSTSAPKIINKTTYQVGCLLREFLSNSLNEDSLNQVPLESLRNTVRTKLTTIKTVLENRIANYEAHLPNQMEKSENALLLKENRLSVLKQAQDKYQENLQNIQKKIQLSAEEITQRLGVDSKKSKQSLSELETVENEYKQLKKNFITFCDSWNKENKTLDLDKSIIVSNLMYARVRNNHQQIVTEATNLFNTDKKVVRNENMMTSLTSVYNDTINNIEDDFFSQQFTQYKELLHHRIDDVQLFTTFNDQLTKMVELSHVAELPNHVLELNDLLNAQWKKEVNEYEPFIKNLIELKNKLISHKTLIEKLLHDIEKTLPLSKIKNKEHEKYFKELLQSNEKQLKDNLSKVSEKMKTISDLIETAKHKMHQLEKEQAKNNKEFREIKVKELENKVHKLLNIKESFDDKVIAAEEALKTYSEVEFQPEMAKIQNQFDPLIEQAESEIQIRLGAISDAQSKLIKLTTQLADRKKYLVDARAQLSAYKSELLEDNGVYIPAEKIPQNLLEQYLECQGSIKEAISKIYEKKTNASSWLGFNWSNISNKVNHYTTLFNQSEFDEDSGTIIDYIENKIQLIDIELKVIISEERSQLPKEYNKNLIGVENCWVIQKDFLSTETLKQESQDVVDQLEKIKKELVTPRNDLFTDINARRDELENTFNHLTIEQKVNSLEYDLALLTLNSNQLEFKVADIDNEQKYLQDIIINLDAMESPEDSLTYIQTEQPRIYEAHIDKMMKNKAGLDEKSGQELLEKVNNTYLSMVNELTQLKPKIKTVKDQALKNALEERVVNLETDLTALTKRKDSINKSLLDLKLNIPLSIKAINDRKALLETINVFTAAKNSREKLLEQLRIEVKDVNTRDSLIKTIEDFRNSDVDPVPEVSDFTDETVKNIHDEITELKKEIDTIYVTLKTEQISEKVQEFKIRYQREKDIDKKVQLHDDIEAFKQKESDFIHPETKEQLIDYETQLQEAIVKKNDIHANLNALYNQYFGNTPELGGVFGDYLQERKETFWFKDFLRDIAAFALGCFGYRTDSQEREDYINELKTTFKNYKDNYKFDDLESQEMTLFIDKGLNQFSPRATTGSDYDHSLQSKLSGFKKEYLKMISNDKPTENLEDINNSQVNMSL